MGKILIPGGGGGGAISDDITLRQSDVPVGLTAVTFDSDDEIVEGTLTTTAAPDKVLKDETFYNTETHQKESGTIESMEAQTITPGASAQTVSCTGKYMTGDVTINAVAGLSAGNIANGVTVGGVAGTYKGLGNATQAQVLSGRNFSTASLSNASGTMTNYSGYTSTSNYVSSTFRSGTTDYVFASPGGTGYYTTGSYLRIPATNLSAANIKKGVTILGITGTWSGFVAGTLDIYNRGTWGSGYNSTWATTEDPPSGSSNYGNAVTCESSAIKVKTSYYNDVNGQLIIGSKSKLINFSPYSSVSIIVSNTPNCQYTGNFYIRGSDGNSLAYINIIKNTTSEKTYTISLSGINVSGYLDISPLSTLNTTCTATWYVHRIWFT